MTNGERDARILAIELVDVCKRSGVSTRSVIAALSVVLGMTIADTSEDDDLADRAVETVRLAIEARSEDSHAGRLQ
jgi:hypothetical protein